MARKKKQEKSSNLAVALGIGVIVLILAAIFWFVTTSTNGSEPVVLAVWRSVCVSEII